MGSIDVTALRAASRLTTTIRSQDLVATLSAGVMLPAGTRATTVRLNDIDARYRTAVTSRGTEIVVDVPSGTRSVVLKVSFSR